MRERFSQPDTMFPTAGARARLAFLATRRVMCPEETKSQMMHTDHSAGSALGPPNRRVDRAKPHALSQEARTSFTIVFAGSSL